MKEPDSVEEKKMTVEVGYFGVTSLSEDTVSKGRKPVCVILDGKELTVKKPDHAAISADGKTLEISSFTHDNKVPIYLTLYPMRSRVDRCAGLVETVLKETNFKNTEINIGKIISEIVERFGEVYGLGFTKFDDYKSMLFAYDSKSGIHIKEKEEELIKISNEAETNLQKLIESIEKYDKDLDPEIEKFKKSLAQFQLEKILESMKNKLFDISSRSVINRKDNSIFSQTADFLQLNSEFEAKIKEVETEKNKKELLLLENKCKGRDFTSLFGLNPQFIISISKENDGIVSKVDLLRAKFESLENSILSEEDIKELNCLKKEITELDDNIKLQSEYKKGLKPLVDEISRLKGNGSFTEEKQNYLGLIQIKSSSFEESMKNNDFRPTFKRRIMDILNYLNEILKKVFGMQSAEPDMSSFSPSELLGEAIVKAREIIHYAKVDSNDNQQRSSSSTMSRLGRR